MGNTRDSIPIIVSSLVFAVGAIFVWFSLPKNIPENQPIIQSINQKRLEAINASLDGSYSFEIEVGALPPITK